MEKGNFFQHIYTIIDETISLFTTTSGTVISLITPIMSICFGIYMILIILSWWRSPPENHVGEWITRMLAWGAVLGLGMNVGVYSGSIAPFFNGLAEDLSNAFGHPGSNAQVIQLMFDDYMNLITGIWERIGWMDVSGTIFAAVASAVVLISAIPLLCIAMAYMILAKLALGILLAIGPIFIAMALFPATRQFFTAWTAQCANYILLTVIFNVAVKFVMTINYEILKVGSAGVVGSMSDLLTIAAVNGLFIFVFLNLPALASGLAGGVTVGGMMSRGTAGKAASSIGGAASSQAGKAMAGVSKLFSKNKIGG